MIPKMLNLHPPQHAAQQIEQGRLNAEDITIRPSPKDTSGQLREIVESRYDRRERRLYIHTKSRSGQRKELEQELSHDSPFQALLSAMEQELSLFCIGQALRERQHTLGLSPLLPAYFEMPGFLDDEQQKILAFFLPHRSQIRGDMVLMGRCFQTALQQPVAVHNIDAFGKTLPGDALGCQCMLNSHAEVGGCYCPPHPCIEVRIGPVPAIALEAWVPSGRQREFLERALLPAFTPNEWRWRIQVAAEGPPNECRVAERARERRLGINTLIT